MKYPSLNAQITEFGVYSEHFIPLPIYSTKDYYHGNFQLHHYIKKQEYYRYPERYKGMQKLILLTVEMHKDLHSAMSDARFYNKWKVERDLLLYRHRKVENEEI